MAISSNENNYQKIPSIELPDDLFEESLNPWRFSLIGRLNLQQLKFVDASIIVRRQWKLEGDCKLIPLGRGFFTIKLDNATDRQYIKEGTWEVTNQTLQIRNWISNFRPQSQRTSRAMVWVRFPGVGLEFWSEKILFKICKEFGNPVKLDAATEKYEVGYYANVLVEVYFAKSIPNKIWIGTKYGGFFQDISIPDCPKFCSTCKILGHLVTECRMEKSRNKSTGEGHNHRTSKTSNTSNHQQSPKNGNASIQQQGPKTPHIPFDICNNNEDVVNCNNKEAVQVSTYNFVLNPLVEDSVVSNITTSQIQTTPVVVHLNSGRFNALSQIENREEDEVSIDKEIMADIEPHKLIQMADVTDLEKSEVKFVDAGSGKVTTEPVQFTSWTSVVNASGTKKTTPSVNAVSNNSPNIKNISIATSSKQAPVKYNFRRNVKKGGKNLQQKP
ncbi:uncharacterized protein LOC113273252 [Papaver somniferum]|uniref:uncharacterized protein LOC113273252 n=1 Tax=Papaver somniferum TaxID=3469 RepID=UPI000E6FC64E|nr:uncharacterized protein LOC113273252 [Papaver somniferum]